MPSLSEYNKITNKNKTHCFTNGGVLVVLHADVLLTFDEMYSIVLFESQITSS